MEAPDKIYIEIDNKAHVYFGLQPENAVEYIRKDIVDETVMSAEDHAYFAGQEKFRERLLVWVENMKRTCKGTESIEKAYQTMIDKISEL